MRTKTKGFTLIELLVVMGILGLLAAILVPSVMSAMQRSKRTYCLNSLKQIGLACVQYANDAKGYWPPGRTTAAVTMKEVVRSLADGGNVTDAKLWVCPSDKLDGGVAVTVAKSPTNNFESVGNCSYAYLTGLSDRSGLPPGFTPALVDESNGSDSGAAPTALKDLEEEDNHGKNYRNILYFDSHGYTLPSGKAADAYKDAPAAGDSAWSDARWVD